MKKLKRTTRYSLIDPTGRLVAVGTAAYCLQVYHDRTYGQPAASRRCWKTIKRDVEVSDGMAA